MKNRSYLHIAAILACIITTYACKKTTPGYLSPYVYYQTNPMQIPKGRIYLSAPFDPDGSTQPYTVSVLHYYNKATGKIVDSLFNKKYPVQIFKGYVDPLRDTTFGLIKSLLTTENLAPVSILPASGQLSANPGALNLPAGEYQYDLKITNIAGTRTYPKIGDFVLKDTTDFDSAPSIGATSETRILVGNESKSSGGKPPLLTITRLADTPNMITVKYIDKNGVPWNPKNGEIVIRPAAGLNPNPPYLPCFQKYPTTYTYTNDASIFRFPLTPFPLLSQGSNIYQRIPAKYVINDGLPNGAYSLNLRFPIRIYAPGSYLVVEQSLDATHAP